MPPAAKALICPARMPIRHAASARRQHGLKSALKRSLSRCNACLLRPETYRHRLSLTVITAGTRVLRIQTLGAQRRGSEESGASLTAIKKVVVGG